MPEYKATPLRVLDQVMRMMVVLMSMIKLMLMLLMMMVVLTMMIERMMLLLMMMIVVLMLMIKMMMMLLMMMLVQLAGRLGIGKLWVKDESYRFNLKAFKVKTCCAIFSFQSQVYICFCLC